MKSNKSDKLTFGDCNRRDERNVFTKEKTDAREEDGDHLKLSYIIIHGIGIVSWDAMRPFFSFCIEDIK